MLGGGNWARQGKLRPAKRKKKKEKNAGGVRRFFISFPRWIKHKTNFFILFLLAPSSRAMKNRRHLGGELGLARAWSGLTTFIALKWGIAQERGQFHSGETRLETSAHSVDFFPGGQSRGCSLFHGGPIGLSGERNLCLPSLGHLGVSLGAMNFLFAGKRRGAPNGAAHEGGGERGLRVRGGGGTESFHGAAIFQKHKIKAQTFMGPQTVFGKKEGT